MTGERLFQMVYLLLEHGRMTAQELSEKLEVSVRTVYRDVDSLSAAGVPICAAQGKGGGVYLMEGYVLERAAFTEEEQRQLLTALRALPGEEGDALGKLSALFRREGDDWLQVQLSRWGGQSGRDGETFQALRGAIRQRRTVAFRYASSHGEILPREVLPARLVFKGQSWYLQGFDLLREDYRSFRLTRMLDLRVTDQSFHRELTPPDIDFPGEIPPLFRADCRLRFESRLAYRVYDEFLPEDVEILPDGRLEVRVSLPADDWLYGYLLSFGTGVEVLEPESLRQRLAAMGAEIFRKHSES